MRNLHILCALASLVLNFSAFAAGQCPDQQGWVYDWKTNACYYPSYYVSLNWASAEAACVSFAPGAHLASIHDPDENAYLLDMMNTNAGVESFWIGMSKLDPDRHQYWTDASPTDYINWAPGQPDNSNIGGIESCIEVFTQYIYDPTSLPPGTWNDNRCDQLRQFVCKVYASNYTAPHYTFPPIPTNQNCRAGWQQFRGRCFKFFGNQNGDTPLGFDDAFKACRNLSDSGDFDRSNLVAIRDVYDQLYLDSMVWNYTQDVWIGLWVQGYYTHSTEWYDDDTPYSYTNYGPNGVPMDAGGCVKMHTDMANLGEWQVLSMDDGSDPLNVNEAQDCTDPQGYICMQYTDPSIPTPPSTPQPVISCIQGFDAYGLEGCYKFITTPTDYFTAQANCRLFSDGQNSANLASIVDPYELAYITSRAAEQNIQSFWIGLHQSTGGQFVWVDRWPVDITLWGPGQPVKDTTKDSVIMTLDVNNTEWGAYWTNVNSNPSISQYPYLCKFSTNSFKPPTPGYLGCNTTAGWIEGNKACYFIQTKQMSFYQAEVTCAETHLERSTHLASFHSLMDLYTLRNIPQFWNTTDRYHIGLNALQSSGHFTWTDNSPLDFVYWAAQQPAPVVAATSVCVTMDTNGQWYTNDCSFDNHISICMQAKFPVQAPTTLSTSSTPSTTSTTSTASPATKNTQSSTHSNSGSTNSQTGTVPTGATSSPITASVSGISVTQTASVNVHTTSSAVVQELPPSGGLSPGGQAGVAIAVIVGVALLAAAAYVVYKRYPLWRSQGPPLITAGAGVSNQNYHNMNTDYEDPQSIE